jgi:hypothetical protein
MTQTLDSASLPAAKPIGDAFQEIYASDFWTLGSGPGSLVAVNRPFITFFEAFIRENRIASIVDFGCGDWQYMSRVDLNGANYLGLDVVNQVIVENTRQHCRSNVKFACTPDDLADLPEGDLIVLKDVLVHLPNAYVANALAHARRKYRFLLAVNNFSADPAAYNSDIKFGDFRPVDLSLAPFSVPCATVLRYGKLRVPDPRLPWLVAVLGRRFVWPGLKHVQLALGIRT